MCRLQDSMHTMIYEEHNSADVMIFTQGNGRGKGERHRITKRTGMESTSLGNST